MHQSYNELTTKNEHYAVKDSSISNKYAPLEINTCSPKLDTYRDAQ